MSNPYAGPIPVLCCLTPDGMWVRNKNRRVNFFVVVDNKFANWIESVFHAGPFDNFYLWMMPQKPDGGINFRTDRFPQDKMNSIWDWNEL
jgi:hypothetical protein